MKAISVMTENEIIHIIDKKNMSRGMWNLISTNKNLSNEFIEKYKKVLNWKELYTYRNDLSRNFIEKYIYFINRDLTSKSNTLKSILKISLLKNNNYNEDQLIQELDSHQYSVVNQSSLFIDVIEIDININSLLEEIHILYELNKYDIIRCELYSNKL